MPPRPSTPRNHGKSYQAFVNSPEGRVIRILCEYLEPFNRLQTAGVSRTVVFFGSARTTSRRGLKKELKAALEAQQRLKRPTARSRQAIAKAERRLRQSNDYETAVEIAKRTMEWAGAHPHPDGDVVICTGGGPGVMEAGNRGAILGNGRSLGLNISLPHEQRLNPFISDNLNFEFNYFFVRKFWFVSLARVMVFFPGGYGTLDELFEVLTLIQTGRTEPVPLVLFNRAYWSRVVDFQFLADEGYISPEDLELFTITDSVDDTVDVLIAALAEDGHV